jgi:hypothetical protein
MKPVKVAPAAPADLTSEPLISKHVSGIVCAMDQPPKAHFTLLVPIENQPIVKARYQHVPRRMLRVSVTPNRANVRMLCQQIDGRINRLDKPPGSRWVRFAEVH